MTDFKWFSTVYSRIFTTSVLLIFSLGLVFFLYMNTTRQGDLRGDLIEDAQTTSRYLASSAEFAMYSGNEQQLRLLAASIVALPEVEGVVFHSVAEQSTVIIGVAGIQAEEVLRSVTAGELLVTSDYWYVHQPIFLEEQPALDYEEVTAGQAVQLGSVVLVLTNRPLLEKQRKSLLASLAVTLIGAVLGILFSLGMSRSIARPMRSLSTTVAQMQQGKLDAIASESGPVEVQNLARLINRLATSVREYNIRLEKEVKKATSQLQKTLEELEEASAAKDQFMARMSHELRTPLTAVIGFSRILQSESDRSKREEYQRIITASSKILLRMIDDLLEFSRSQSGTVELEHICFDTYSSLNDVLAIHRRKAAEKGLEIELRTSSDLPQYLIGDPTRLAQVINNLLNNAVKFTDHGGVVVAVDVVDQEGDQVTLRFSVIDTGKGIANSSIQTLFSPFAQEDTSIKRRYGGSGLGLVICRNLVELMDGAIEISSQEGHGTEICFTVKMALATESDIQQTERLSGDKFLRGQRGLIVEDNEFNQKLLFSLLTGYGAKCLVVENGLEAVELLQEEQMDFVIMDIHMPGMDGVAASERIVNELVDCPVIIGLTADITESERERMLTAGAVEVLMKPIDEEKLINCLGRVLKREAPVVADGGLLSAVMPVSELRSALRKSALFLQQELNAGNLQSQRQAFHDLIGLSGLYGMSDLRNKILNLKAKLAVTDRAAASEELVQIFRFIERIGEDNTEDNG